MQPVTMKAYKYNGALHYESSMVLIERREKEIILFGPPHRELIHHTRGKTFTFEEQSIEFYFSDRWYTVACVVDLSGGITFYYCNIAVPCEIDEHEVRFVDLDLDVIVQPDYSWQVVDQDEFLEHQERYQYGTDLVRKAEEGVRTILRDIQDRSYPFDGSIDAFIRELDLANRR